MASQTSPDTALSIDARPNAAPRAPARQDTSSSAIETQDPLNIGRHRRENVSKKQMKIDHPAGNKRKLKKYYSRQNELIDKFLGADDEEANAVIDDARYAPRIKFAVNMSFVVNLCLFVIQMYAAIATGSLSLFATAADAFMDLVSSFVMLVTSRLAARPSVYKYPVVSAPNPSHSGGESHDGEALQIIPLVFVGIAILAKTSMMIYCFIYRRFPAVQIFFIDHRNDIVVNIFGLAMSIVGDRFVWYLDPIGAIFIALLILFSWVTNAFEHVWLLVGKSAPKEFISKLIYMAMTHDDRINKVDTCRAYHAGQNFYVEIDIVMDEDLPLRTTHDIGQDLQRKLEGLSEVERAFVHIDYEHAHDPHEEHKPLYLKKQAKAKRSIKDVLLFRKPAMEQAMANSEQSPPP
ncbi:hypothetical protein B0T26DRAFT_742909 [Lasiosphaeria miniovina]|uniref:Cation efflux protein cytoplasmic domain-containing protein n=1 Tax=Lasiosphaeria miniovina TaxID=1954250 RepID=A0AA40DRN6_9PEZI|nr:uncharacterized protein B0T26DRAFT_742909 [Lasiosphaeria miniovina]KAK0709488.1 hypothetical protein B0T26DRAFT_742909 [Lasiosphaeria miniovina]